jgi:Cdc6-like AAA superfamily ATPase
MPCTAIVADYEGIDIRNGRRGTGKTGSAVYIATEYQREKNLDLIANIHINSYKVNGIVYTPEYESTENIIQNIIEGVYRDCVILLDELHLFINSLATEVDKIKLFTSIFYQCRKSNINIICAWIRFEDVHKRIRRQFDFVLVPRKYHDLELTESCAIDVCDKHHYIAVYAVVPQYIFGIPLYILDMEILGQFYNTFEVVKHEEVIEL